MFFRYLQDQAFRDGEIKHLRPTFRYLRLRKVEPTPTSTPTPMPMPISTPSKTVCRIVKECSSQVEGRISRFINNGIFLFLKRELLLFFASLWAGFWLVLHCFIKSLGLLIINNLRSICLYVFSIECNFVSKIFFTNACNIISGAWIKIESISFQILAFYVQSLLVFF